MKTKTIVITDPKDYRNGDRFRGTSRNYRKSGATVHVDNVLIGGSEDRNGDYRYRDLYVKGNSHLPYVHYQSREQSGWVGFWEDVTVTREVEVEPTTTEILDELPVGSLVRFNGESTVWFKRSDGWVSKNGLGPTRLGYAEEYTVHVLYRGEQVQPALVYSGAEK